MNPLKFFFVFWFACLLAPGQARAGADQGLLKNGELTQIENGLPAGWTLGGVTDPENYQIGMQHKVAGEPNALAMVSAAAETSRYVSQYITVEPGASYEWRVKIHQDGGRGMLWVRGIADISGKPVDWEQRNYLISYVGHALYPDFVPGRMMRGSNTSGWRLEKIAFRVPPDTAKIQLLIGVYFATGSLWVGPMELIKIP